MEGRTETTQNVIDAVAVHVHAAVLNLHTVGDKMDVAKTGTIEEQVEAFELYVRALERYTAVTDMAMEVIGALGDGYDEYDHALRDAIEEVE